MTSVVGIIRHGELWMAADSMCSTNHGYELRPQPKIFIKGRYLIGTAGSPRQAQLLKSSFFDPPKQRESQDLEEFLVTDFIGCMRKTFADHGALRKRDTSTDEHDSNFLIGVDGKLFTIEADFQLGNRLEAYNAIGSGKQYALGAMRTITNLSSLDDMHARHVLGMALEAAQALDPWTRQPFFYESVKLKPTQED